MRTTPILAISFLLTACAANKPDAAPPSTPDTTEPAKTEPAEPDATAEAPAEPTKAEPEPAKPAEGDVLAVVGKIADATTFNELLNLSDVSKGLHSMEGTGYTLLVPNDAAFARLPKGTIDPGSYMQITDRSKDVIKSGGEWISSIALENLAMGFPGVAEAAVIGVPHAKWAERPLLIVVRRPGAEVDTGALLGHLATSVPRWWLPDAVEFIDALPHTATGKVSKLQLRQHFKDYRLPAAAT